MFRQPTVFTIGFIKLHIIGYSGLFNQINKIWQEDIDLLSMPRIPYWSWGNRSQFHLTSSERQGANPTQAQGEHANVRQNSLGQLPGSNPEPSCFESTVLSASPPCHQHNSHWNFIWNTFISSTFYILSCPTIQYSFANIQSFSVQKGLLLHSAYGVKPKCKAWSSGSAPVTLKIKCSCWKLYIMLCNMATFCIPQRQRFERDSIGQFYPWETYESCTENCSYWPPNPFYFVCAI